MTLTLIDASSGLWLSAWNTSNTAPSAQSGSGSKTVSAAPLTTVRVGSANGADTFAAGSVNVFYE
jgi:hypothetical protein